MNYTTLLGFVLRSCFLLPVLAFSADVEVTLKDRLDGNLNGYCLDIRGGGQNIDPSQGLQGAYLLQLSRGSGLGPGV